MFNSILDYFNTQLGLGKSFFLGFVISASGSLVIGALHLMAIQISVEKGWQSAILFSSGAALVEGIFVRYMVSFTQWLSSKKNARLFLEWILLILFFALSLGSFYAAMSEPKDLEGIMLPSIAIPTFFLGMGIRFFYPSMIPFWLAWNTVLVTRKIQFKLMPFVIGTAIATVLMHSVYIFAGQLLIDFLQDKKEEMLFVLGALFFLTGVFQVKRMMLRK